MIPVSSSDSFKIELEGVRFFVTPLTGENEGKYLDIIQKRKEGATLQEQLPFLNEMFDFFVINWEPIGKILLPAYSSDPSKIWNYKWKSRIINEAIRLSDVGDIEVKN